MKTAKKRKQVSIEYLDKIKYTINHLLGTKLPQSAKQKLCFLIEGMLQETKSYSGFKYLYWSKYGCLDWEEAKQKGFYREIPKEFLYGPDDNGTMDFVSDIQGEWSRFYT